MVIHTCLTHLSDGSHSIHSVCVFLRGSTWVDCVHTTGWPAGGCVTCCAKGAKQEDKSPQPRVSATTSTAMAVWAGKQGYVAIVLAR